jgi:acetolactate synthase-1/2/3 large subunit
MIKRLQEKMFDNRTVASVQGYSVPDYSKIAGAYGIKYLKIESIDQYALVKDFISRESPRIIEVIVPQTMRNLPEPGASIARQTPLLSDEEFALIAGEASL